MIDIDRTSRAQQTIIVVVAVALVTIGAVGALTTTASGATLSTAPGADAIGAGETTISADVTDTSSAALRGSPLRVAPAPDPSPSTPATSTSNSTTSTSEAEESSPTTEPGPETTLRIDPSRGNVRNGKTGEFDVVVDDVDGGVGAAEMAIVVGDSSVATITDVTVLGSGEQAVTIAENGSRANINYTSRDTYDSGTFSVVEVTVKGQSNGETSLSLEAANGSDELFLFDEHGTAYNVTGTIDATVSVTSGKRSESGSAQEEDSGPDVFQIDLVEGAVIQQLNPDEGDTYHKQDRFIMALHTTEDERWRGGPGSPMDHTYQSNGCEVAYSWLSFHPDTGESQVVVSVSDVDGCEGITLSYAGYELPNGTTEWDGDRADEQELMDSITVTLESGDEEVLTVDVIPDEESSPSLG